MKRGLLYLAAALAAVLLMCTASTTLICRADEGISIQSYRADIYLNGTLQENYVYKIDEGNRYRMLYRPWKLPLSAQKLGHPYVEPLSVDPPQGSIPYVKDRNAEVTIFSPLDRNCRKDIQSLADLNEIGCYNPQRFPPGVYNISYLFKIHPPIECDATFCHWNLRLADDHYPYQQVAIYIHDPDGLLVHPIPHPDMYCKKEGDMWAITGSSPENGILEVEMLLSQNASAKVAGFARNVSNVKLRTISAQKEKSSYSSSSEYGGVIMLLIFFGFVVLVILFNWSKRGRGGGIVIVHGSSGGSSHSSSHSGGRSGGSFGSGGGHGGGGGRAR